MKKTVLAATAEWQADNTVDARAINDLAVNWFNAGRSRVRLSAEPEVINHRVRWRFYHRRRNSTGNNSRLLSGCIAMSNVAVIVLLNIFVFPVFCLSVYITLSFPLRHLYTAVRCVFKGSIWNTPDPSLIAWTYSFHIIIKSKWQRAEVINMHQ